MSCSAIIRAAYYFSKWEKIQRPTPRQCERVRDLGTLSHKLDVFIKSLRAHNSLEEKAEIPKKPAGMNDTKEIRPSKHNMTDTHLNSGSQS